MSDIQKATGDTLISKKVLAELINRLEEIVNNYCWNLEPLTDDDVADLFDADANEVTYYGSIINDNLESKNFIWSSKKVAEQIAQAIVEAGEYSDSLMQNISSIKLDYVESLPTVGNQSTIYILKSQDASKSDTLNLYNGKWISIGDFKINLEDYVKKVDYEKDMALKANENEVIKTDSIKTDLTATDLTNTEVLGALATKSAIDNKMDKTEIVNKLDKTVTNKQLVDAKTIYDNCIGNNNLKTYTTIEQLGLTTGATISDIFNILPENSTFNSFVSKTNYPELPDQQGLLTITKTTTAGFNIIFKRSGSGSKTANTVYMGQLKGVDGTSLSFNRICTTKTANISATLITFNNGYFNNDIKAYYEVKNGLCTITFMNGTFLSTLSEAITAKTIATGLPIPSIPQIPHAYSPWASNNKQIIMFVNNNGDLILHTSANIANACVFTTFSYFVKEA